MSQSWSRSPTVATKFSRRSSIHRSGFRSSSAAAGSASSSGWNAAFGPKPPPVSGATTRMRLFRDAERRHQDLLGAVRRLGVDEHGQRAVDRVEPHRDAARLDGVAAALVQAEALLDAMRRFGERAVDVAVVDALFRDEIVRAIEPRLGRAGHEPRDRIDHRRQRFQIERDQGQRVLGDAAAFGHHHRDRLADISDLVLRQHEGIDMEAECAGRQRLRDAVAGQERPQVGEGQHRMDAGQGFRRAGVDAFQSPMRHRAPQEGDMQRAGNIQIVNEAALAAQQRRVLDAQHAAAEQRCGRRRHRRAAAGTTTPCAVPRRRRAIRRGSRARASWRNRGSSDHRPSGCRAS